MNLARRLAAGAVGTLASGTGDQQDLVGQTVVVIGGSSGIGLETARLARARGAEVVLTARDPDRLRDAATFVVQHQRNLGGARCGERLRAGEDQLAHSPGPQYPRALLPDREEHSVGDVALARPVGTDDRRDASFEWHPDGPGEGLEALDIDR